MIVIETEAVQLEYVLVPSLKSSKHGVPLMQQLLRPSSISGCYNDDDDDECCSLTQTIYSLSSSSSSSTSSSFDEDYETTTRRVSFSIEKNEVHFVERYSKENLEEYFYSYEDEQKFREESNLERKLLAELGVVDQSNHEGELEDLLKNCTCENDRQISHVLVLHNDKIESFSDPMMLSFSEDESSSLDDFFDNDNFWNGSMTWH